MLITGYENTQQAEALWGNQTSKRAEKTENSGTFPASWSSDTWSFSSAAREAQQAAQSEKQNSQEAETERGADGAQEAFSQYMRRKRGAEGTNGSDVESLKARLKELQSQLTALAKDKTTSDANTETQMNALQQEMNQVIQQIAELEAAQAEAAA